MVDQAEREAGGGDQAEAGQDLHQAAEDAVHAGTRERLFDEQVGAAGGEDRGQAGPVLA